VIVLRQPLGAAFSRGVRRLRAGPVEVEFDQELAEVREELSRSPELAAAEPQAPHANLTEELARLAEVSPRSAVLEHSRGSRRGWSHCSTVRTPSLTAMPLSLS
jgi:hypothetical protein